MRAGPLARLRLRAEFVEAGEQQRKMFGDLEAMNAMIDTTLAFASDDARQEPRKLVDLGVLVGDICEDMADAGSNVCYLGPRAIETLGPFARKAFQDAVGTVCANPRDPLQRLHDVQAGHLELGSLDCVADYRTDCLLHLQQKAQHFAAEP